MCGLYVLSTSEMQDTTDFVVNQHHLSYQIVGMKYQNLLWVFDVYKKNLSERSLPGTMRLCQKMADSDPAIWIIFFLYAAPNI